MYFYSTYFYDRISHCAPFVYLVTNGWKYGLSVFGVTVSNVVMNVIYKLGSRQYFISFGYTCADVVADFICLFYIQPLRSFQTICQVALLSVSSSSVWGL